MPEEVEQTPEETEQTPEETEQTPEETEQTPEEAEALPEEVEQAPEPTEQVPVAEQSDLQDAPLDSEEPSLQYGEAPILEYMPDQDDLQKAQDDLEFAQEQQEAYQRAVDAGEVVDDPAVRQQLNDSVTHAETHLEDVKNGQPYSMEKPGDYWSSPEGKELAGDLFAQGTNYAVGQMSNQFGVDVPKGENSISRASKDFGRYYGENYGYDHIGRMADGTQELMQNVQDQYETPGDRYMQDHFLRDENGDPLTAAEAREASFADESTERPDRTEMLADTVNDLPMIIRDDEDLRNAPLDDGGVVPDRFEDPWNEVPSQGLEKIKALEDAEIGKDRGGEMSPEETEGTVRKLQDAPFAVFELPEGSKNVRASDIDMSGAMGMDDENFWNHHGNTKEDYMELASKLPDVQDRLKSGERLEDLYSDPDIGATAYQYYDPNKMVRVEERSDGSYEFLNDGRHRVAAAQELGHEMPVKIENAPFGSDAPTEDPTVRSYGYEGPVEQNRGVADLDNGENDLSVSNETRECLNSFGSGVWDELSQAERESAVEELRDNVANDLQIQNKPQIAYYDIPDPSDFGGYAASTNTIYINRYNMDDSKETADTVAHESRHCWQHECADDPKTEQDYLFKENFEDYIRPEDDFYAYQEQPVEADARAYAATVTDMIPNDFDGLYDITDTYNDESGSYENNNESNRAPPEDDFGQTNTFVTDQWWS